MYADSLFDGRIVIHYSLRKCADTFASKHACRVDPSGGRAETCGGFIAFSVVWRGGGGRRWRRGRVRGLSRSCGWRHRSCARARTHGPGWCTRRQGV